MNLLILVISKTAESSTESSESFWIIRNLLLVATDYDGDNGLLDCWF